VSLHEDIRNGKGSGYYKWSSQSQVSPVPTAIAIPINNSGQLIDIQYDHRGLPLKDGPPATGSFQAPYWTAPQPYKILRQPTKTSDPPYQMPEGTAIDLRASGFGKQYFFQKPSATPNPDDDPTAVENIDPVYIMFTPEGRVDRVWYNPNVVTYGTTPVSTNRDKFNESLVDNVFLMVGKRENIPAPAIDTDITLKPALWSALATDQQRLEKKEPINWLVGESRWVVIGSQSGRVVSIENAAVDPAAYFAALGADLEAGRSRQILAAREFTSDMANMGGR
jgi:hypothetical protein